MRIKLVLRIVGDPMDTIKLLMPIALPDKQAAVTLFNSTDEMEAYQDLISEVAVDAASADWDDDLEDEFSMFQAEDDGKHTLH